MFGTLGFSELIIILAIVLIIFGAGRLPQIGEGLGKALKGFKKEVHEAPPVDPNAAGAPPIEEAQVVPPPQGAAAPGTSPQAAQPASSPASAPYRPGPEATPGTTAALVAAGAGPQPPRQAPRPATAQPQPVQAQTQGQPQMQTASPAPVSPAPVSPAPVSMEQRMTQPPPPPRATYPALPPSARPKPVTSRPSVVVNKEAVARVQAQQAALKAKAAGKTQQGGLSPQDMQSLGEGIGDALRTFRKAAEDVRGSIDPEMRTIRAEMEAAQKEIEQSVEAAKQTPAVEEEPPKT
jgi:TatA/E family protein of Tat protein translocase